MKTTLLALSGLLLTTTAVAQLGIKVENTATTSTASYIEVPYNKTLVPRSGITIEAWVTYDESTLGPSWRWPTICRLNPNAGQEAYWLRIDAGQTAIRSLAFGYQTSTGLRRIGYSFAAAELTTWTHVAATFENGNAKLFVNGDLKAQSALTAGSVLRDQGGVLRIGNGDGNPIENWNGEIDEVRVWPFARTSAEIKSTMNQALSKVPGEVSSWNLDFGPTDSSGGNDGADVGSPNYGVNSLTLNAVTSIGAESFGAGTAGCNGTPVAAISGYATPGNQGLALTCHNAATGVGSIGFLWLGLGRYNNGISVNGADLWVDLNQPGLLLTALGNTNGLIKLATGIPPTVAVGTTVHMQYYFGQAGCAVPAFASQGLTLKIQ